MALPPVSSTQNLPAGGMSADDIAGLGDIIVNAIRNYMQQQQQQKQDVQQAMQMLQSLMQNIASSASQAQSPSAMSPTTQPPGNQFTAAQPDLYNRSGSPRSPIPTTQPDPRAPSVTTPELLRSRNQPVDPQRPGVPAPRGKVAAAYRDYQQNDPRLRQENPRYRGELDRVQQLMQQRKPMIDEIARRANLPPALVAGLWYRENSQMRTDIYLHNGQQLGRPTTIVPRGIHFRRDQFVDAAVHALRQKADTAQQLGLNYNSTDRAAMAAFAERYNGFGYRNMNRPSAYVTAGTGMYNGGMYVRDHVFNPSAWDRRPGVMAIVNRYMR